MLDTRPPPPHKSLGLDKLNPQFVGKKIVSPEARHNNTDCMVQVQWLMRRDTTVVAIATYRTYMFLSFGRRSSVQDDQDDHSWKSCSRIRITVAVTLYPWS